MQVLNYSTFVVATHTNHSTDLSCLSLYCWNSKESSNNWLQSDTTWQRVHGYITSTQWECVRFIYRKQSHTWLPDWVPVNMFSNTCAWNVHGIYVYRRAIISCYLCKPASYMHAVNISHPLLHFDKYRQKCKSVQLPYGFYTSAIWIGWCRQSTVNMLSCENTAVKSPIPRPSPSFPLFAVQLNLLKVTGSWAKAWEWGSATVFT